MIDGSEERKRQLALDFIIRVFLKGAVKYESGQCKTQTVKCRLHSESKMQAGGKMQN